MLQFGRTLDSGISLSKSGPKMTGKSRYFKQKYLPSFLGRTFSASNGSTDLNCSGFPLRIPVARQNELMTLKKQL